MFNVQNLNQLGFLSKIAIENNSWKRQKKKRKEKKYEREIERDSQNFCTLRFIQPQL